jgi:hypothetical protein
MSTATTTKPAARQTSSRRSTTQPTKTNTNPTTQTSPNAARLSPHVPSNDWGEFVQAHVDGDVMQTSPDEFPVINIHSL